MRQQDIMSNIRCYQIIAHNGISDIKFRTQNKAEERRSQWIDLDFRLMNIYNETISFEVLQQKLFVTIFAILIQQKKEIIKSYESIEIKFHLPA